MSSQKQKDIKTIAVRVNKILNETKGLPLPSMFWDDLDMLISLILQDKEE
jgi:hypothetical protein